MGSWRADEPSPHRLHRCTHYTLCQTVRSYKTITPKMSAFGTSTPYYAPPRGLSNRGRCPHPRSPRGRGAGDAYGLTPAPQPQSVGSPPTSKGQGLLRGCFASLDRFPAPSASDRFATPKEMERGHGDAVVHFTLDALESTSTLSPGECG